jgi:L-fucose isomerase-like protein
MTQLYRATVGDVQVGKDGLPYYVQAGEPHTIDATPMVRLAHGVLVPAAGWHAEYGNAVLEAAQRIEVLGHRLLAQADRLRAEAAAKEKVTL